MQYRVFNGSNIYFQHGFAVPELRCHGDVVVAVDPSKTNCAVVVGDPVGNVIAIVEISGNGWSAGKAMDTTLYCSEVREFITRMLTPVNVLRFGLEKAITKKGMEHHHSNMVLTEIRAMFLSMCLENYGFDKKHVEVNNWSWKRAILPEGYRSQSEKGSKRYFREYLHDYTYESYYEADVTDALCIYKFLIQDLQDTYKIACTAHEEPIKGFKYMLMPSYADALGYRRFDYNPSFSIVDNVVFFVNRSMTPGIAVTDTKWLKLSEIYGHTLGFEKRSEDKSVRLVVHV